MQTWVFSGENQGSISRKNKNKTTTKLHRQTDRHTHQNKQKNDWNLSPSNLLIGIQEIYERATRSGDWKFQGHQPKASPGRTERWTAGERAKNFKHKQPLSPNCIFWSPDVLIRDSPPPVGKRLVSMDTNYKVYQSSTNPRFRLESKNLPSQLIL